MLMKNFSKFLGLAMLCASLLNPIYLFAQDKGLPGFVIKGQITGVKDSTKVMLVDIDSLKTIDSAYIISGQFKFKGRVDHPRSYWIKCLNEYAIVQVENVEMTFSSPINKMKLAYKVEGGKEQALLNTLNIGLRPYESTYTGAYDSLQNKLYTDSAHRKRLVKLFNDANNSYMDVYIAFGKKNINSYLGLDIVYRNRKTIAKDSVLLLYNSLLPDLQKTNKAMALKLYALERIAKKGEQFIDFEAKTITGAAFKLSTLKNKYIYLAFGSFACGPCRIENKEISENYSQLSKVLHIVNFSLDVNRKEWEAAAKADGITWYNVSDMAGMSGKIKTLYDVQAIPTSFLIDKNGVIVERFDGYSSENLKKIQAIINQ